MEITSQTRVADVATEFPATIRVFQRYGIDFCCGGKRALSDVCGELNLELTQVKQDLDLAVQGPRGQAPAWQKWSLADIIGGIVHRYHRPLDEELPRLAAMMQKVLSVHGERHPELSGIAATFRSLRGQLVPHMQAEEEMLFPYLVRLEAGARSGGAFDDGDLSGSTGALETDHVAVGRTLAELRERTSGYRAPEDACNTFRGLYHGFAELEQGLHEHIHVENNILFPRAAAIAAELAGRSRAQG